MWSSVWQVASTQNSKALFPAFDDLVLTMEGKNNLSPTPFPLLPTPPARALILFNPIQTHFPCLQDKGRLQSWSLLLCLEEAVWHGTSHPVFWLNYSSLPQRPGAASSETGSGFGQLVWMFFLIWNQTQWLLLSNRTTALIALNWEEICTEYEERWYLYPTPSFPESAGRWTWLAQSSINVQPLSTKTPPERGNHRSSPDCGS